MAENEILNNGIKTHVSFDEETKAELVGSDLIKTELDNITVSTDEEYKFAHAYRAKLIEKEKELTAKHKAIKAPILEAGRQVDALFKPVLSAISGAKQHSAALLLAYDNKKKMEAARIQAELDERARKEKEKLIERAKQAEEKGKIEKAEALSSAADLVQAPVINIPLAAPKGTYIAKSWKGRVTSLILLCKAIGGGLAPPTLVEPVNAQLNALAKLKQSKDLGIEGVEGYIDEQYRQR